MLFVGPVDQGVSFAVGKGVRDAGGTVVRTRSISVPLDIAGDPGRPAGRSRLSPLPGRGSHRPISATRSRRSSPPAARRRSGTRSAKIIVQEREGSATPPADAVVVVRSAEPQRGLTKALPRRPLRRARAIGRAGRRHRGVGHVAERHPGVLAGRPLDRRLGRHLGRPARPRPAPRRRRARAATASARRPSDGVLPSIPPVQPQG